MRVAVERGRTVVYGFTGLVLVGLLVLLIVEAPGFDVIARGHFVDYTEHEVLRVRVFDAFTFLAAPESAADTDVINTLVLAILVGVAALAGALSPDRRLRLFFLCAAVGAFVLAVEEAFELTETLGYNIGWVEAIGIPARKLDVLDVVPAGAFVWGFRDIFGSRTAARWFWASGVVLFLATVALELVAVTPVEDAVEVVASASLLLGFFVLAVDRLYGRATA